MHLNINLIFCVLLKCVLFESIITDLKHLMFVCQDLGVAKVGHMKRILQGIRDLSRNSTVSEA